MRHPFRYALTCVLAASLLLPACDQFSKATEETLEAADNLKEEAIDIKEGVEETVDQVNNAKNSVIEATDAVNQAVEDLKAIGD